jgi:hypothetical protein
MSAQGRVDASTTGQWWVSFAIAWALLVFSGQSFAKPVQTESTRAASATVTAFYKWYLHELKADREPLQDGRAALARYVSRPLLREIDHRMRSAEGMDVDYFIQAQDYLDDWENHIVATNAELTAAGASVVVELGAANEDRRRLAISLAKEGRTWKIRQVEVLAAPGKGSQRKR